MSMHYRYLIEKAKMLMSTLSTILHLGEYNVNKQFTGKTEHIINIAMKVANIANFNLV